MKKRNFRNLVLALAATGFIMILGAGIYEHITIHSKWIVAPPRSLYIFQGKDGIDISTFWKLIHPFVLLLFIASLILFWKTEKRNGILIPFAGYVLVLVCTAVYFVPELIKLTGSPYSNTVLPELQHRAALWNQLNIVRAVVIFVLAVILLMNFFKPEKQSS